MATKKASAKKTAVKKTTATKAAPAKKTTAKKVAAPAKKTVAKKTTATKAAKKTTTRKFSPAAGKQVGTEMREMKKGTLKSGRGGKKVTNPKQAIAIGLNEARKAGKKVPPAPKKK